MEVVLHVPQRTANCFFGGQALELFHTWVQEHDAIRRIDDHQPIGHMNRGRLVQCARLGELFRLAAALDAVGSVAQLTFNRWPESGKVVLHQVVVRTGPHHLDG